LLVRFLIKKIINAALPPTTKARKIPKPAPRTMFSGLFGLTGALPGLAESTISTVENS
jgi:hypothetical protein